MALSIFLLPWVFRSLNPQRVGASSGSWWWTGKPDCAAVHGVTKSRTWLKDWIEPAEICSVELLLDGFQKNWGLAVGKKSNKPSGGYKPWGSGESGTVQTDLWMEWAQNLDGSLAPVVVVGYFLLSFSSLARLLSTKFWVRLRMFYENVWVGQEFGYPLKSSERSQTRGFLNLLPHSAQPAALKRPAVR